MQYVVVERTMPAPIDADGLRRTAESGTGCLDLHGVQYLRAYIRPDGLRLICLFRAPDAEAVRTANRQLGMPFDAAYPASFHEALGISEIGRDASLVLVERTFGEPVHFADVQSQEERGAWCLDLHGVRFVHTLFSSDRQRMICIYEAPDAEAVRLANQKTRVPFDTVWTASILEP